MKLNSTVVLSSTLLLMMIGTGGISGYLGYVFGYEALKGVTQPDDNPTKKLTGNQYKAEDPNQLVLVKEKDVIVRIYDHIQKHGGVSDDKKSEETKPEPKEQSENQEKTAENQDNEQNNLKTNVNLPVKGEDQNVVLEIINVEQQGGSLTLDVKLRNEGKKTIRFLYSFLDVKDDQGKALSAITDGLPGELPPNGEDFAGTIKIPAALLDQSQTISLTLTDYPEQKLQLKIQDLPIAP